MMNRIEQINSLFGKTLLVVVIVLVVSYLP